jgi:hypothetical protein
MSVQVGGGNSVVIGDIPTPETDAQPGFHDVRLTSSRKFVTIR